LEKISSTFVFLRLSVFELGLGARRTDGRTVGEDQ